MSYSVICDITLTKTHVHLVVYVMHTKNKTMQSIKLHGFLCPIGLVRFMLFPIANTILRGFLRIRFRKFYSKNRGSPKAFFECFWDLNGRFFIFKIIESRFGRKIPKSALFYCEKLSQSFRRFLVRYAELMRVTTLDWFGIFCFPYTIKKKVS